MSTIDELYTELGLAKRAHAPLAASLEASRVEWRAALAQLGLAERALLRPHPHDPPVKKNFAVADLASLAAARIKAQADHDASAAIVATVNAEIQQAIAAKGA